MDISIAYLNKKRKPQAELLDTPLPKHVCWGQNEFSSDLTIEPKKASSSIFAREVESIPESVSNSYSFPDDVDSSMSSYDDTKTSLSYPKTHASVGSSTSTNSWDDTSSQIDLYSIESRTKTKESSKKSESTSISDYGMLLSEIYEDQLLEYGSHGDCSFSEYKFNGVENCGNTDLEDLLNSNGIDASNYVLSSGRWPVGQGIISLQGFFTSFVLTAN